MYKSLAKTLFIGKNLIFLPSCQSTNQELYDRIPDANLPDGSIIITDNQTQGRGQRENRWYAEPGKNLTFSLLLYPKGISAKEQFTLNMAISLGISDALRSYADDIKIKWPNDIYAGDRKLGGLLIQNTLKGHLISHAIIGIGLNINQQIFTLPQAVSLGMLTGRTYDLATILTEVCYGIEGRYMALLRQEDQRAEYMQQLYAFREERVFRSDGIEFTGKITDVRQTGELVIHTEKGLREFRFKEVEFV